MMLIRVDNETYLDVIEKDNIQIIEIFKNDGKWDGQIIMTPSGAPLKIKENITPLKLRW